MLNKEQVEFIVNNIDNKSQKRLVDEYGIEDYMEYYSDDLVSYLSDHEKYYTSDEELEGKPNYREFNTRNAVAEVNGRYFAYDEEYWSKGIREVKPIEVTTIIFNYI